MKKTKRILALVLAAATLTFTACGSSSTSNETSTETQNTSSSEETTFTFGCDYFSESLDPSDNVNSAWQCSRLGVGENLFKFDENAVPQYNLCDEATTEDYITWTLHVRDGVKFSNGNDLTASAVVACWERMQEKEAAGGTSSIEQYLPEATFEADDSTGMVTVHCSMATPNLKGILAYPFFEIIDTTALVDGDELSVIGTGPYVLTSYEEAVSKTFVKNENYWNGEVPYSGYTATYMTDSSTKAMSIQSGDVDVVENITTATDLEALKADSTYTVESTAGGRVANVYYNFNGALKNDALRQAIKMAVDSETMCDVTVGGIYTSGCSVIPSSMDYGYDQLTDTYTFDTEKAKTVLDDAGIVDTDGDGVRELDGENLDLNFLYYESRQLDTFAESVAVQLNEIGIGCTASLVDYDTAYARQQAGDFDMITSNAIIVPTGDPTAFMGNFNTGNAGNYWNYSNDEYDKLYEQLETCTDDTEKKELLVQMQQILIDDAATLVLGYYNSSITYVNSKIQGVTIPPLDYIWITTDWKPAN